MVNQNNMDAVYATDEYGRPYVIVRDQGKKSRIKGLEAQKVPLSRLITIGTHSCRESSDWYCENIPRSQGYILQ